ncbi:MAG: fluoride efflux transporter FluC [Coriobacteriales bacterium]|jgi:CrcB protein
MFVNCLVVGAGGFVGSILRYLITLVMPASASALGTLGINVVGSFAIAVLSGLIVAGIMPDEHLSLLLRVGVCGGFTTLAAFSLEAAELVGHGAYLGAIGYAAITCFLCVGAALLGTWLVRGV